MAAGDTAQGRRVADVVDPTEPHPRLDPGDYRRTVHPVYGQVWEARAPTGPETLQGNLAQHTVTEHEDGTITVSPSILIQTTWAGEPVSWHGFLERGTWREV